ncbi:FAS1-like dehydratase domain-containing protein [Pacificoceanicola onchidii]|uniref:FAS1-like dehydratase domain-containing protein n=1 Tax=Pacificoceanicola onchidii TaxID=2562685 RepID=UPI0010A50002|nr:MaoC family dehydratase N-terminal domain-containing protein [Pacificoceanicola onchidii]
MQDAPVSEHRQIDPLDPARARALQAALGLDPNINVGSTLPPFFHQIYFWDPQPSEALGRDGHPAVGQGLFPSLGLPRRMWAGGALTFHAPLRAGVAAEKVSSVESVVKKEGRTGPLGFVTLRHEIRQAGGLCVTEMQDLVYREDPDPNAPKPAAPEARRDEEERVDSAFDTTLLFRYSALTFNGHRIHYDLAYSKEVEGYAGLVVHGPLLAQKLMLLATRSAPIHRFRFRATAPLMHFEEASFCRNGGDMWVRGSDGRQCMTATVE